MKLCADCKHYSRIERGEWQAQQNRCVAMAGPSPVDGSILDSIQCEFMRSGALCGWEGKLWEAKGGAPGLTQV